MTSREIFNQCVSLMFGETADRDDYLPFWRDVLNLMLAETHELNNALRKAAGKPKLKEIPFVSSEDEEVECEPQIARLLLPLGGASYMFLEDEPQIASYYGARYRNLTNAAAGAEYVDSMESV